MNWTGGSLSRSRKQNATLSVIQKKHFVKARGALLNGHPQPPRIDLSFFKSPETKAKVASPGTLPSSAHSNHWRSQHTLDKYDRKPQSLRSRRSRHHELPIPPEQQNHSMPVEKRSTALHSQSEVCEQRPAPQNTTTEHHNHDLEAKRQALLGDFDWVGLEKMKPVKMKFADAEDRDLIGKRRRLATNHEEGHSSAVRRRKPVLNAYERLDMLRARSSGRSSPEKISVHIGSSDHLFSQQNGSRHSSREGNSHGSPLSEKMLFQDRESVSGSIRRSASLQCSLPQGQPSSEEMLFDSQWSYASLPRTVEPANVINDSWTPPKHQPLRDTEDDRDFRTVHLISSGDDSDNRTDFESVEEGFEHQQDQKLTGDEEDRHVLPGLAIPSVLPTSTRLNKLEKADQPTVGHEEGFANRRNKDSTKISPTDLEAEPDRNYGDERASFALATAPKTVALFPNNRTRRETSHEPHKLHNPEEERVILDRRDAQQRSKNASTLVTTEMNKTITIRREDEVALPLPSSLNQPAAAIAQIKPITSPPKSPRAAAPVPHPPAIPIPIPQEGKTPTPPTPDPTPAEDELLWRKFVFGTTDPDDDWIFTQRLFLDKPQKPANSSSPLLPAFAQATQREREEGDDEDEEKSSLVDKIHTSLLAEASSSSSTASPPYIAHKVFVEHQTEDSSPARPQPLPSTIAGDPLSASSSSLPLAREARTESPTRTQHSIQAQASTSSAGGSPGPARRGGPPVEAGGHPHASLQPPVIFARPKRFVGESSGAGAGPVRLGVSEARGRGKKRKKQCVHDEEDDGEYQERGGKRRKGKESRGMLKGGIVAAESGDEGVVDDEIVD